MEALLERARAQLARLEADRQAAVALSEQKAEEAKLIKARQEGFQAAMEILSAEIPSCIAGPDARCRLREGNPISYSRADAGAGRSRN